MLQKYYIIIIFIFISVALALSAIKTENMLSRIDIMEEQLQIQDQVIKILVDRLLYLEEI